MNEDVDLAYLRRRRHRQATAPAPQRHRGVLTAVLVGHGMMLVLVARLMVAGPGAPQEDPRESVLVVELLPETSYSPRVSDEASRSVAESAIPKRATRPLPTRAIADDGYHATTPGDTAAPTTAESPTSVLFNPDGSLRLPEALPGASAGEKPFQAPVAAALPTPRNPVRYRATRFDPAWKPDSETLLDRAFRAITIEKAYDTAYGTRFQCSWLLVIGGCGWGLTPREPAKPAPWLAVAGELAPEPVRRESRWDSDPLE